MQGGWSMLAKSQQVLGFDLHPTTDLADWPRAPYLSSLYLSFLLDNEIKPFALSCQGIGDGKLIYRTNKCCLPDHS